MPNPDKTIPMSKEHQKALKELLGKCVNTGNKFFTPTLDRRCYNGRDGNAQPFCKDFTSTRQIENENIILLKGVS
ncbi:MAG: hypothetical protein GY756_05625 [bacterium]|nr:hypothetical protein [bacterium]